MFMDMTFMPAMAFAVPEEFTDFVSHDDHTMTSFLGLHRYRQAFALSQRYAVTIAQTAGLVIKAVL